MFKGRHGTSVCIQVGICKLLPKKVSPLKDEWKTHVSKCKQECCCWISFHVFEPKLTNFYGRKWIEREPILMQVTRRPQALRTTPMLLAVTPLPSPLTTPPVTKTYFIVSFRFLSGKRAATHSDCPGCFCFYGTHGHSRPSRFPPLSYELTLQGKIVLRCHLLYLGRGLSG